MASSKRALITGVSEGGMGDALAVELMDRYGYMMPILDSDLQKIKLNFDVNVFGMIAVTQAFFPMLRISRGILVNQCSIAGLMASYQPFINSYQASKSAAVKFSGALRVELRPFGVKVVTLITGAVDTPLWQNTEGARVGIPANSRYLPIKDRVEAMMTGQSNPAGLTPAREWAKGVVADLLKTNPPIHIRRGYLSITMWIVNWLMPWWMMDWLFTQSSGTGTLQKLL
ncbi:Hypothetical protein R9X50_00357400 [Acrodontium crateriforme]|uniref:Uncharacterized protein n=1 Tax=Acrodontium crateriforme TaxID=150365 RepID=A0AAQ3M3N1_9PEZI|nr:Hypothetical protein R9X50_00357400 [Acrodontium crateriforme]